MKNLWNDSDAAQYQDDLGLRVYTSRLLGRDTSLVLHGGGNTSVKIVEKNVLGDEETILYVKGSGWDLETIEAAGFAPVRMQHLLRLAQLPALSDPQMVNELKTHTTRASAPAPSVETILHAILPYKYVDHTHADALIAITNTQDGFARIKEIYGASVVVVPYIMPGFDLARLCAEEFSKQAHAKTQGMVLMNHGIFSFGDTARITYERMLELVGRAENYLAQHKAWDLPATSNDSTNMTLRHSLADLRAAVSRIAGNAMILSSDTSPHHLAFARHPDIEQLALHGPNTPDHVIRTKRLPMLGRDVTRYAQEYNSYFNRHATSAKAPKKILDQAPRVVIDPELGVCSIGRNANDAAIVGDIYSHTIDVILRAHALGGYRALPEKDLFDMEYWDLEQAKLNKGGKAPVFSGEIALVTGAASGIGKACVNALLARGAAVIGIDINPQIEQLYQRNDFVGIVGDVSDETHITAALESAARAFGGLDMLILNAGIFPASCAIETLTLDSWRKVMAINLDANLLLMRHAHPLLKLAPRSGRVVVIGSKNVPAPGPGAAAYSASKAALNQLARVAALEWGKDNIRVNSLHPNAVFDTALWTDDVLQARAKSYGMSVKDYKTNNVMKVEVSSRDVAELAAEMCGPLFAKTTGAQVPVDGGNERVI